jgi:hypothetical protein
MKMNKIVLSFVSIFATVGLYAQSSINIHLPADSLQKSVRTSNFPKIKKLNFADIQGAPILSQPIRIDGSTYEVRTEEHGLAYPTMYDWNHDGKPDLLVGEFLTGQSRIKVYLNVGTKQHPKFTGDWFYAKDKYGKVISNYQWCCIGIHPQIVDVNGDGIPDIVSGQYYPGVITWWKGTPDGFEPGKEIPQLGYQSGKRYSGVGGDEPDWSIEAHNYWNYSSARLADFNGDGLPDLFVAGTGGYRVALNIGTKEEPKFGRREFLFQTDGTILHTYRNPKEIVAPGRFFNATEVCSGTTHCYLDPIDWDGDGVIDLFITDEYVRSKEKGIYFARGVKTQDGIRFEKPIPLFTVKDGSKALPGCCPHIQVADYNGDGVNDIIMGLSIPTINGFEGALDLYYKFIDELGLPSPGKDTGEQMQYYKSYADVEKQLNSDSHIKDFFVGKTNDLKYLTLRHRGYAFVFLGKENSKKATSKTVVAAPREFNYDVKPEMTAEQAKYIRKEPISCHVRAFNNNDSRNVTVTFETLGNYHLYTSAPINKDQIPVTIDITFPDGLEKSGDLQLPPIIAAGAHEIYDGKTLQFVQPYNIKSGMKPGKYTVKVRIRYSSCSDVMCLPPVDEVKEESIIVN